MTNPSQSASSRVRQALSTRARQLAGKTPPPAKRQQTDAPAAFNAMALETPLRRGEVDFVTDRPEVTAALAAGRYDLVRFEDDVEHQEPPHDLAFAAVCNDKYAPGLEALVLSLRRVYPNLASPFIVFHDDGLSDFSRRRLSEIYPRFEFRERDTSVYTVRMDSGYNHIRVGLLGYLTLEALEIEDYSWIVILDADLLVLGDISALWRGDAIKAVPDAGARPFSIDAEVTGRPVINSGVLALPRSERGPEAAERMREVLSTLDSVTDPALIRFADQKFWNVYLSQRDVELLPQNYNTNKTLLTQHFPTEIGSIRILHLTGPKPWYGLIDSAHLTPNDRSRYRKSLQSDAVAFALWSQAYNSSIAPLRIGAFRAQCATDLEATRGCAAGRSVAIVGDADAAGAPAGATVIAGADLDGVSADHLILTPALFGGWRAPDPTLAPELVAALAAQTHGPTLWAPFYVKPYLERVAELASLPIRYVLLERPLSRRLVDYGVASLDLTAALYDSGNDLLSMAVPIAAHLGADSVVLAGLDPSAQATPGKPTSKREIARRLYARSVFARELAAAGVGFVDAHGADGATS